VTPHLAARALTGSSLPMGQGSLDSGNIVQRAGDGMSETRLMVWCAKCAKVHPAPSCLRQERKEACIVVGGHCDGGAEANTGKSRSATYPGIKRTPGPVVTPMAFQALSQPSTVSSPHPRRKGLPPLTEDLARRDGSRSGLQPPAAGGGIIAASAARTSIPQTKEAGDALNVTGL